MIDEVWNLDRLRSCSPCSNFYAVLGKPIGHSLSPVLHGAAFQAAGIAAQYVKIECAEDELEATVSELKRIGARGWNCTVPLKEAMAKLCDRLKADAQTLGTVNTVVNEGGELFGFNTDGAGWVTAVREALGIDVRDLRVMIIGAGGTGRSLALKAALENCEGIVVANRTLARATALAKDAASLFASKDKLVGASARVRSVELGSESMRRAISEVDLLVNATTLGWRLTDESVVPANWILPHLLVYDTVYRPRLTPLLKAAATSGARGVNGLGMLLHQGALAWTLWTGREAPVSSMQEALERAL
jgi:shikimate dehydrogenase